MKIKDVEFFNTPKNCLENFEKLHWAKKNWSCVKSWGTFVAHKMNKVGLAIQATNAKMDEYTRVDRNLCKNKLIVCVHGLNDSPSQFKRILDEIILQAPEEDQIDIHTPYVLEKGNGKLDEMVKPIFDLIAEWAKTPALGEKELVLVGVSNGARIIRAVETEVLNSEIDTITNLRFISIVGACQGSQLVDWAKKWGLTFPMSQNIWEEMPVQSERTKRLKEESNPSTVP